MKLTNIIAAVLLTVGASLFAFAWHVYSQPDGRYKDLVPFVPGGLAFVGSVAVAILAGATSKSTEELKAALAVQTNAINTAVAAVVPKRLDGFHEMWRAASEYHRALKKLEAGINDEAAIKSAESSCLVAIGKSLLSTQEDEDLFYEFWQSSNYIAERAKKIVEEIKNPVGATVPEIVTDEHRKAEQQALIERKLNLFWKDEHDAYARELKELRSKLQKRLLEAIPKIPTAEEAKVVASRLT